MIMMRADSTINKSSCDNLPLKQKLRSYLVTKSSGLFWFLVDNISCKLDGLSELYEKMVSKDYNKEYSFVNLPENHNILHIGCGAYPLTDIMLAKISDSLKIVGIDNDPKAVELAKRVIEKKALQKQIKIEHADGRNYPVRKFDTIIISSCSHPKTEVLEHVFKKANKQSKIIVRELDNVIKPVIQCIKSHKEIVIIRRIHHNSFPFIKPVCWQTFYLQKKGKKK